MLDCKYSSNPLSILLAKKVALLSCFYEAKIQDLQTIVGCSIVGFPEVSFYSNGLNIKFIAYITIVVSLNLCDVGFSHCNYVSKVKTFSCHGCLTVNESLVFFWH